VLLYPERSTSKYMHISLPVKKIIQPASASVVRAVPRLARSVGMLSSYLSAV
jgi:hypothetical protein